MTAQCHSLGPLPSVTGRKVCGKERKTPTTTTPGSQCTPHTTESGAPLFKQQRPRTATLVLLCWYERVAHFSKKKRRNSWNKGETWNGDDGRRGNEEVSNVPGRKVALQRRQQQTDATASIHNQDLQSRRSTEYEIDKKQWKHEREKKMGHSHPYAALAVNEMSRSSKERKFHQANPRCVLDLQGYQTT
ncbi:hypothetical protein TGRH88_048510 [Toxoplasma gondii]|uniref:Uncharacterized protein n=1 Tax=Toxoplasma gondii TaxID=5811 RepID=A0A7J6JX60_TOXGO|nr:hypothetical protein TGRH88_048510 [Toxoplasma gondii]